MTIYEIVKNIETGIFYIDADKKVSDVFSDWTSVVNYIKDRYSKGDVINVNNLNQKEQAAYETLLGKLKMEVRK